MNPIEQLYPQDTSKITIIFAINSTLNRQKELKFVCESIKHCAVKQVQGCYEDFIEDAYVCKTSSWLAIDELVDLCFDHGQESILIIKESKEASLYYLDTGKVEPIGTFVTVSPKEALESGDWTRDGSTFWKVK